MVCLWYDYIMAYICRCIFRRGERSVCPLSHLRSSEVLSPLRLCVDTGRQTPVKYRNYVEDVTKA